MNMIRRFTADQNGGPAIEFAFIIPILLVLLMGIIQFGYAFYVQSSITNAAREGARALSVKAVSAGGGTATVCTSATAGTAEFVACDYLSGLAVGSFSVASCSPAVEDATLCPDPADVTVRVTVPRTAIAVADILGFFGSGTMTAQSTMREEGFPRP